MLGFFGEGLDGLTSSGRVNQMRRDVSRAYHVNGLEGLTTTQQAQVSSLSKVDQTKLSQGLGLGFLGEGLDGLTSSGARNQVKTFLNDLYNFDTF